MQIRLRSCTLRPFRRGDEPALEAQANDRDIAKNLRDRFPHPYGAADAERWVAYASAQSPTLDFVIEVDGALVGAIGITLQDDIYRRSAEIGYWLGRAARGRGIATEAVLGMAEHTFANFEVVRLFAGVFEHNPASARVLEKAGFVLEGRLRKSVFKDGALLDQLLYALVR